MIKNDDRVITMTSDVVFKSVLQDRDCEDYLVDIISGITKIDATVIKRNLVFKNTELVKDEIIEKGKTTDLLIELGDNVINLEMNKKYYDGLFEKNDRYVDKIKDGLVSKGDRYGKQRKVIQINFDNFELFDERIIIKFKMLDTERGLVRSEYLLNTDTEIYHINLKRIRNLYYNSIDLNKFQKELLIMTIDNMDELMKVSKGYKEMVPVVKKISKLTREEEMQGIYIKEEQEEFIRQRMTAHAARKGYEEGVEQGVAKGILKGSYDKEVEIVKNMLSLGIDIETIEKSTGMSKKDIIKIDKK